MFQCSCMYVCISMYNIYLGLHDTIYLKHNKAGPFNRDIITTMSMRHWAPKDI